MSKRTPRNAPRAPIAKLAPLAELPRPLSGDERCELESVGRPVAAALRSPPKKYPRLRTLSSLAQEHLESMRSGDFVQRSRLRWESESTHADFESDGARALRVSRESAALVIQSAWRRSAAVRLRERLIRAVWQRQTETAAWLARDREDLRLVIDTLRSSRSQPLVMARGCIEQLRRKDSRLATLSGAFTRLPALRIAIWLCFHVAVRHRTRFLRRPAPTILRTVHIPVLKTCRLWTQLWQEIVQNAVSSIQSITRKYLARCVYWKLFNIHRRRNAAIRVQTLYRAWVARRLVVRLRRRRSAICVQCWWRCVVARRHVNHARIVRVATMFITAITIRTVEFASHIVIDRAAVQIQRTFRGRRARGQFRVLVSQHQFQQWYRNPSRGYRLFESGEYLQAAVYLEHCFRQGIFQGRGLLQSSHHHCPWRPNATDSFSDTGAPLTSPPSNYDANRVIHTCCTPPVPNFVCEISPPPPSIEEMRFWLVFGISHWFSFQSNGDILHLQQARRGLEAYVRCRVTDHKAMSASFTTVGELQCISLYARASLAQSVYLLSGDHKSKIEDGVAFSLCIEVLDDMEILARTEALLTASDAAVWCGQLLVTSAALCVRERDFESALMYVRKLQELPQKEDNGGFSHLNLQFLVGLLLLHRSQNSYREAEAWMQRCYQQIEMWPGVGFYYGEMKSDDAIGLLQDEPVGSFLLHREVQIQDGQSSTKKLLLKVKLAEEPCRISSLRIHSDGEQYHTKRLPNVTHFGVHELIKQLPEAAGIDWTKGIRRQIYVSALQKKLTPDEKRRRGLRAGLLDWEHWKWRLSSRPTRRNDCWGVVCRLFAVRLEACGAYELAAFVARDGLVTSRDRALRADLFFCVGKAEAYLQRRVEAAVAMQQARIESARLTEAFDRNFSAIQRAVSCPGNSYHPFSHLLERVRKIERMAVKAWSFDSCSRLLRGHPFCEALLLQRIQDETTSEEAVDTFFLRSLVRAHVKAFVTNGYYEIKHVELALDGVRRLFNQFQHASKSVDDLAGLVSCSSHIRASLQKGEKMTLNLNTFSLPRLLLSWGRLPFVIAFEMAEVFYRWPETSCDSLIDVYESLFGRLRGMKPRNWHYSSFEELFLIRLVFLYTLRSTRGNASSLGSARKAVELMNELIALRTLRGLGRQQRVSTKRIDWPKPSLRFPMQFSLDELIFVRGYLWERLGEMTNDKTANANAWRDYDELHRRLLWMVTSENKREMEVRKCQRKLKGVRVFVGETVDVTVRDILHSKPFAYVECEKTQVSTQNPATWMNQLSPSWNEFLEIDVRSSKARLTVVVMNRSTKLRRQALRTSSDLVLGYAQFYVEDLLARSTTAQRPQWYNLVSRDDVGDLTSRKRPRIRLGFQVLTQSTTDNTSLSRSRTQEMNGNWDIAEVKANLRGDLEHFIRTSWVWRWFAQRWEGDMEFSIATWFLQRCISLDGREARTPAAVSEHVSDLERLAVCYRATKGSTWLNHANPLLEEALKILSALVESAGPGDVSLHKRLSAVSRLLGQSHVAEQPLNVELVKHLPASSHWIAMRRRDGGVYYFNEDTCDRFESIESEPHVREPLEWEDGQINNINSLRPRRMVVMTTEMQARVTWHCELQQRLHDQDPGQWVAVYNPRKQVMQFFSLAERTGGVLSAAELSHQPPTYAMVADSSIMYYVLVVQDAFRAYQQRCRHRRRLRGLLRSAYGLVCERHVAVRRIYERTEIERKRQLNCLHLFIERATQLRAMDLFTSDPFVLIELVDRDGDVVAKGQTSVKPNTLNPQWNEEFRFHCAFVDNGRHHPDQQKEPLLRFRVYDRDIVKTRAGAEDEWSSEHEHDADSGKDLPSHDFMGLATASINPLMHGKCVTADLVLRGESNDESPRSYGTLTVTVQWVNDPEHDLIHQRRNAVKPMLLVRSRKRTRPKPVLQGRLKDEFDMVVQAHRSLVFVMSDVAVLLDQLVRLFKRWRVAQASGKTADEAKLLDLRLHAAVAAPQPFYAKQMAICVQAKATEAAVSLFISSIQEPILEFIDSCEKESMASHRETWESATTAIRNAILPPGKSDIENFKDDTEFVLRIGDLLKLGCTVECWRREVLVLLTAFFDSPHPSWELVENEMMILQHFEKVESVLKEAAQPSRPSTATGLAQDKEAVAPDGAPIAALHPSASTAASKANAALAKRMQRIERERRKQKQK